MIPAKSLKSAVGVLAVAGVHFITAKLGLRLAYFHARATPVWPGTGIALVVFLVFAYRVWPGILLGAFLCDVQRHVPAAAGARRVTRSWHAAFRMGLCLLACR